MLETMPSQKSTRQVFGLVRSLFKNQLNDQFFSHNVFASSNRWGEHANIYAQVNRRS